MSMSTMSTLKKYKVNLMNEPYTFISDEQEENFNLSVERVDSLMREISEKSGINDTKRIAILVALELSSKLNNFEKQIAFYNQKEIELIKSIDQEFFDNTELLLNLSMEEAFDKIIKK